MFISLKTKIKKSMRTMMRTIYCPITLRNIAQIYDPVRRDYVEIYDLVCQKLIPMFRQIILKGEAIDIEITPMLKGEAIDIEIMPILKGPILKGEAIDIEFKNLPKPIPKPIPIPVSIPVPKIKEPVKVN